MQRVKIALPAVVTRLAPALTGLGLAFSLRMNIEITERADEAWIVETDGEGAGRYGLGLRHPVTRGMIRVFQRVERAPMGVTIRVNNPIPYGADLGVDSLFIVAGVIGANNMIGTPLKRPEVVALAANASGRADQVVTGMFGGLTTSLPLDPAESTPLYRNLPIGALKAVLVLPQTDAAENDDPPTTKTAARVPLDDALYHLARVPLFLDALKAGDLPLLARLMDDKLTTTKLPRGYDRALAAARGMEAAITLTGSAILAFTTGDGRALADAMQAAFNGVGVIARWWALTVDTQGVVVSVVGS
jgi:homoserine kinase